MMITTQKKREEKQEESFTTKQTHLGLADVVHAHVVQQLHPVAHTAAGRGGGEQPRVVGHRRAVLRDGGHGRGKETTTREKEVDRSCLLSVCVRVCGLDLQYE